MAIKMTVNNNSVLDDINSTLSSYGFEISFNDDKSKKDTNKEKKKNNNKKNK